MTIDSHTTDPIEVGSLYFTATTSWDEPKKTPSSDARDARDYAIEFGGYLANTAERFMQHHNSKEYVTEAEADLGLDVWRELQSAIYEFRKRAERAKS